jgi:tetratricopeptide (TPR) repeat protein
MSQQNRERYQQARVALDRGRLTDAHALTDRMIAEDRKDYNGWLMRGRVRLSQGRRVEAISDLKRAQKLQPKNPRVFVAIGDAYRAIGDHARAIAQYDKALDLDRTNESALAAKVRCYELQNKPDRALRLIERRFKSADPPTEIALVYVRVLDQSGDHERAAAIGRRVAEADSAGGPPLRQLCFAVAKACERLGNHAEALTWARRANETAAVPFDRELFQRIVESLLTTFTVGRLRSLPRATIETEAAVFVVGMPRSGSTLVERILDAHPDGFGAGELPTLHLMVQQMPERIGSLQSYPACVGDLDLEHVNTEASAYLAEVRQKAGPAKRIVDKHLANFLHLGVINCYFPHGHVIHSIRDPVNTCLSCYFERLSPRHVPYASDFEDLAYYYAQYRRVIDHFRAVIDVPVLDVAYEALVADQEPLTRRVLEFVDLPFDERCLQFHRTKRAAGTLSHEQVTRPIYSSSLSRADRFGELLDPLRDALRGYGIIDE